LINGKSKHADLPFLFVLPRLQANNTDKSYVNKSNAITTLDDFTGPEGFEEVRYIIHKALEILQRH